MCEIIDLMKYRRARLATHDNASRARLAPRPAGMVTIGVVSAEIVRRLNKPK